MAETQPAIYKAICNVMNDVSAVEKNRVNKTQGFKFRGIDDVMNALHPLMAKHHIFVVPEILKQDREERKTLKGGLLIYSICKIRYTFFAEDGSSVAATVIGEGMDSGDKATNKAMAIAFKYACFQVFCIPTEEMVDADEESHEVKEIKSKPEAESKKTKKASDDEQNKQMQEKSGNELIDIAKLNVIKDLLQKKGVSAEVVCNFYKIKKLEDMTVNMFMSALKKFEATPDKG